MPKKSPVLQELYEHIESSYFLYKICEGCDKLLMHTYDVCPNCNAYRFNTAKSQVVKKLKKLLKQEQAFIHELIKD